MPIIKMTFTVEINNTNIVQHSIEIKPQKCSYFSQERKLTKEIVDKMNGFYSEWWVDSKPWTE